MLVSISMTEDDIEPRPVGRCCLGVEELGGEEPGTLRLELKLVSMSMAELDIDTQLGGRGVRIEDAGGDEVSREEDEDW